MNFELTDEQRMLRDAATDALGRQDTLAAARAAADGADPLDLWPVAADAGWAGLLVGEERGGAGLGLLDAMLVLEQAGRRLATHGADRPPAGDAGARAGGGGGRRRGRETPRTSRIG